MNIGRKIFYDKLTGNSIKDTGEYTNALYNPTVEQEINTFIELSERNRDTFDVLELPYRAYQQDFAIATGYRVNVETKELEFQYPDPNEPEVPQPYTPPLSEEINSLKDETAVIFYDSMMKDAKIIELEDIQSALAYDLIMESKKGVAQEIAHADLMYTLMMNGVV